MDCNNEIYYKLAAFAGGCFWCLESPFRKQEGVLDVVVGYTGGHIVNPTYEEVCTQTTGHYEAVQIAYDPKIVSYEKLLDTFWRQIDPMDEGGQFYDRGSSYMTAIFYYDEDQKKTAEISRETLQESGRFPRPITTKILPVKAFFPAEEYHQQYYRKNTIRHKMYSKGSGREDFIKKYWCEK